MKHCRPLSPLRLLAEKWCLIGLLAVAFARLMRAYEEGRVQGAAAQAAELEICLRAAHILLLQDIAETLKDSPPQTEADADELQFLQRVTSMLLAMVFVIQRAAAQLCGPAIWLSGCGGSMHPAAMMPAQHARAPEFLDSG